MEMDMVELDREAMENTPPLEAVEVTAELEKVRLMLQSLSPMFFKTPPEWLRKVLLSIVIMDTKLGQSVLLK